MGPHGGEEGDETHHGDLAPDLEAALLVLVAREDGLVRGERDDGARGLHAKDLGEGLDGIQALPGDASFGELHNTLKASTHL